MRKGTIEFYEVQRLRQWWMWLIMIGVNAIFLWGCVQQLLLKEPWGNNPLNNVVLIILTVVMLLVSIVLLNAKLHTYVNAEGIYVKYFPFHLRYKFYDWNNIHTAYVTKYSPMREFGGWGIKYSIKAGKVYNVSGNMGLQLVLMNSKKVLIGTQQPEHLTDVLTKLGKMKN